MPRKRKRGRTYLKDGRYYADLRDLGGKLEALKPPGERLATTEIYTLSLHDALPIYHTRAAAADHLGARARIH